MAVSFIYMGFEGRFIEIRAGAATGKVIRKADVTPD
jgi:hypothetical protein